MTLTQVHGWLFHVDFVTPGNSTFGLGADHTPNAEITVDPFVQAWTAQTYRLVPQQGTTEKLDTLGDKIMTPVVYQNRNGTESLWADQTMMLNFPNGPTAVALVSIQCYRRHFPCYAGATTKLDQWQRRFVALDAQHSRGSKRKYGDWLFYIQPIHVPGDSLCRASFQRPVK